ncbi:unnamed protein product [Strongylus vulgaris]|uniref:Uncharacterized protein n=1 Tax=Strongylus vulgaris TaxID=40348 RepID=A0A3P7L3X4_STRVU|nr:unnamed protein product [Strongylus vulgaris]
MFFVFCLLSLLSLTNALNFGCGCSTCPCGSSSYGYGGRAAYGYSGYNGYQSSYASSSYPSGSYYSSYPPGQISGYILRPVGPIKNSGGYAVAGGYNGGSGIPVVHQQYGQIG